MLNVMQSVRKQIAETGKMQHPSLRRIFKMADEGAADEALLELARRQVLNNDSLVMPWATTAPLLLENVAISRFTMKNPDWKMALPEILTIPEAAQIAQADYLLTEKQTKQLIESLKKPLQ